MVSGVEEIVRYSYRLRPGAQAQRALLDEWHRCRWLWNEAVHQQRSGRKPTRAKLGKLLTAARARNTWLRAGWQNAQANMLNTYAVALDRSFTVKGCGKPAIKKRHKARPSLELNRNGFAIREGPAAVAQGREHPGRMVPRTAL
jgi:putative transposase